MATEIEADDLSMNPKVIAAAWEAFNDEGVGSNGIPAVAAAALVNEFTDHRVTANEGVEADRDVLFRDVDVMVEEKAIGVCSPEVAERFAVKYVDLNRDDGYVLVLNEAAIYEDFWMPPADDEEAGEKAKVPA